MRFNRLLSCGVAWAAVLIASSARTHAEDPAGETYELRYKFQPRQSVYFTVHNETHRTFQRDEVQVQTQDGNDSLKHFRVLSNGADGSAVLELTIDRTRMYAEQGDVLYEFDSTRDSQPPAAFEGVAGAIGGPWLVVDVDALGETTNPRTPGGRPVVDSPDLMSRVLPVLPAQAVGIGETWKEKFETTVEETEQLQKPVKMLRTYTLTGVEGEIATIEFTTRVLTPNLTPKQETVLAQRKYSGTITFDMTQGLLLRRELRVKETVLSFDGPQSSMTVEISARDEYAATGAATPAPPPRVATAKAAPAQSGVQK